MNTQVSYSADSHSLGKTRTGLEIWRADEQHLEIIRDLNAALGNDIHAISYDRWRYFSGPYGTCPTVLAMDGGRAAGLYTVWPVKMRLGKETLLGAQSMDTMTHPDYRGKGIFLSLAQACYDLAASQGYDVVYGFPNGNSYPGFIRRLNWDHTGDIVQWVRPIKPSGFKGTPAAFGPVADLAAAMLPKGSTHGLRVAVEKPAPEALQALLESWSAEPDVCRIERSPEWLDWRYAPEAEKDYEWICAYRDDRLVAAGVWGMQNQSWGRYRDGRARIGELLGEDPKGLQAIIAAVIGRARTRGAILIETRCNVEPVVSALKRAAFFSYLKAPFIVRSLTARTLGGNIHNHASWRVTGGDWDGA